MLCTIGAIAQHCGVSAELVNQHLDPEAVPVVLALVNAEIEKAQEESRREAQRASKR